MGLQALRQWLGQLQGPHDMLPMHTGEECHGHPEGGIGTERGADRKGGKCPDAQTGVRPTPPQGLMDAEDEEEDDPIATELARAKSYTEWTRKQKRGRHASRS